MPGSTNRYENNYMPNHISVRQLSKALRKARLLPTPFVDKENYCRAFEVAATDLGFTRSEVESQIRSEQDYLQRTANGNGNKSTGN